VFVIGATATGKTAVGVELALALGGEVINADSRLFYRGMDVATAKPSAEETKGVPHHLIDFLDPNESYGLAEYLTKARSTIQKVASRGLLPIVVGGSGQYIWALIEGWEVPQIEPDVELRTDLESRLEAEGIESLASCLREIAPDVADSTELQNPRRVIRAIERVKAGLTDAGSNRRKADEPPFESLVIGLTVERSVLHDRVLQRLSSMQKNGWLTEVESLLADGYTIEDRALSGIGYRQMIGHLAGDYDLDEAVRLTVVASNRLIRQQDNWFKREDDRIGWFDMTADQDESCNLILKAVRQWHDEDSQSPPTAD